MPWKALGLKMVAILLIGSFLVPPLGKALASPTATITITVTMRYDTSPPKVNIYRPKNGDKISGDGVIIKGSTQDTDILSINYQYRSSNSSVWTDIISTMDTGSIYSVIWDTTNLPDGDYDLRAVAIDKVGNKDPNPPFITVVVNHKSPDYSEDIVKKDKDNVIKNEDGTKVEVPKGALNSDTIIRISKPNPAELPPPKNNPTGLYLKIEFESGQRALNKAVTISMPYKEIDNNGIVDGTNIFEENLKMNIYVDPNWVELPTTIDTRNNIAKGKTTHFTIFGVFGALASNLDEVIVYPNPFKPGKGDRVIKFLNLTEGVTIRIYNIAGELIRMEEDITTGFFNWDAKNEYGEKVAGGVYIYIITDDEGRIKKGKIAIIR